MTFEGHRNSHKEAKSPNFHVFDATLWKIENNYLGNSDRNMHSFIMLRRAPDSMRQIDHYVCRLAFS